MTEEPDGAQTNTDPPEDGSTATPEPEGSGTQAPVEPDKSGADGGEGVIPKKPEDGEGAVPVDYKLSLPEDSLLEPSYVDKIAAFAKERGLSKEDAQAILDREAESVEKYVDSEIEKEKDWIETTKNDPKLGGENFEKTGELCTRVTEAFGDKELAEFLNETRGGNHPAVVRFLAKIGSAMADDSFVKTKTQEGGEKKSVAQTFYGDTTG